MIAIDIVYLAIDQVNADNLDGPKIGKEDNFLLLDKDSNIDSLLLVNLFVALESVIETSLGKTVSIVDEGSFESEEEPFKNIGNLVAHVKRLLNEV